MSFAEDALRAVKFGDGVAENDRDLDRFFVRTNDFEDIIDDNRGLILAPKGAGKTAIAQTLVGSELRNYGIKDIIAVPATPDDLTNLFLDLDVPTNQSTTRQLWLAYFVAVAYDAIKEHVDVGSSIGEELSRIGIDAGKHEGPDHILEDLVGSITRSNDSSGATGSPDHVTPAWAKKEFSFKRIAGKVNDAYETLGKRCWIVLDRLDAFPPEVEFVAIRALFDAHMALRKSASRIDVKMFLRSDIYKVVTRQEYRNLDHISVIRLAWRDADVIRLVATRIRATAGPMLNLDPQASDEDVVSRFLPRTIHFDVGERSETMAALQWCLRMTRARPDEPSPRNVLRLLDFARRIARDRHRDGIVGAVVDPQHPRPHEPLMTGSDLHAALAELSLSRRYDTLNAEFNYLKPVFESFDDGSSTRYSLSTLRGKITEVDPNHEVDRVLEDMQDAGFLFQEGRDLFEMAPLYWSSFRIGPGPTRRNSTGAGALNPGMAGAHHVRVAAKELTTQREGAKAVLLIADSGDLDARNASLGVNLAIEYRRSDLAGRMEVAIRSAGLAQALPGRLAACRLAQGSVADAIGILRAETDPKSLNDTVGAMVGSLHFDVALEKAAWTELMSARDLSSDASPWDRAVALHAASRATALARSLSARNYEVVLASCIEDIFGERVDQRVLDQIISFVKDVANDYASAWPPLRPYQIVSLHRVLMFAHWEDQLIESRLAQAVRERLRDSEEQHIESFREWSEIDRVARMYLANGQ